MSRLLETLRALSFRGRVLLAVWTLFFLLVALSIHGSSLALTAKIWKQEIWYSGYTDYALEPVHKLVQKTVIANTGDLPLFLGCMPNTLRADEWRVSTMWALSQLSHSPKFPVVNTNIGAGQNMLLLHSAPVFHVASLARPATWGYMLFGAGPGLAWQWWFPIFACFTVLLLLFEIILEGDQRLAAFGAFWFCSSAYIVCWSLWPAHATLYPALGCLCAYHLLNSSSRVTHYICGLLLGLSVPGMVMFLYPPWQVTTGYFFLVILAGLFIRDRLYPRFKSLAGSQIGGAIIALVVCGVALGSFLQSCLPEIRTLSQTAYPGKVEYFGANFDFAFHFRGFYNALTNGKVPPQLGNACEASSFYLFYPVILLALCFCGSIRRRMGAIGWLLVAFLLVSLCFLVVGFPLPVAKATFFSYIYRPELLFGLISTFLAIHVLRIASLEVQKPWALIATTAGAAFFMLAHGLFFNKHTEGWFTMPLALFFSLIGGYLSYLLVAGRVHVFCGLMSVVLIATSALFNPLTRGLPHLHDSELARQVVKINAADGGRPLWLCYGQESPGVAAYALGARSLSGVHFYPQLELWRALDPSGASVDAYNRYAHVFLLYSSDRATASFATKNNDRLEVAVSPHHPGLKAMGAKYVLATGDAQAQLDGAGLKLLHKSDAAKFSIYEIPQAAEATP